MKVNNIFISDIYLNNFENYIIKDIKIKQGQLGPKVAQF